jgi:putative RecB family exonuclease
VRSHPAPKKEDRHVQIESDLCETQAQEERSVPDDPPPRQPEELLAQQNPQTEKEETKMVIAQLPDHLSYSQLNTYLTCPLRYKLHYVEQIPAAFTSAGLVFGSSIHEAVGAFYHQHLLGDHLKADQMVDVYRQAWRSREAEGIRFFNGDNAESLVEKAAKLLGVFYEAFDHSVAVLGVEEFFEISLGDMPPLQGYIDLIEQDENGQITVADLKTAARKPTNGSVHQNLQLTAYSVGVEAIGFTPDEVNLRLDLLTKTKDPQMVRLETTRTDEERDRFIKLARHVWNAIEQEAFFPRQDWTCKQCAWAEPCAKW